MHKRLGNFTIASKGFNIAFYFAKTQYQTLFAACCLDTSWTVGRSQTAGVTAIAIGPLVAGKVDVSTVLSPVSVNIT